MDLPGLARKMFELEAGTYEADSQLVAQVWADDEELRGFWLDRAGAVMGFLAQWNPVEAWIDGRSTFAEEVFTVLDQGHREMTMSKGDLIAKLRKLPVLPEVDVLGTLQADEGREAA